VDPHGNFGSLDDSPAASRYTECRLGESGLSLIETLDEDTVDFVENYDGTEREPSVLPAAFPNLLVNGSTGVAVGMATNIPPHNLAEVVAAARYLLENPKASSEDLVEFIPAPDFPTGGEIVDLAAVREMYLTGKAAFSVRARAEIVDLESRRKGIEVTELPYMVGPEKVVERVRTLLAEKRLAGIADVSDFSDRRTGLRLVFELKNGFDPEVVLADLYKLTPMEESFSASMVALIDHRPKVCSLRDLLKAYVDHRIEVVRRRSEFRLEKAQRRLHLVEGLLTALDAIDEVVALIRSSKTTEVAKAKLIDRFEFSAEQTAYILEMPLRRLTGLEVSKLRDEMRELKSSIAALRKILGSKKLLNAQVISEIENTAAQFDTARRTALATRRTLTRTVSSARAEPVVGALVEPDQSPSLDAGVGLALSKMISRPSPSASKAKPTVHDVFTQLTESTQHVLCVSRLGFAWRLQVSVVPTSERGSKGVDPALVLDLDSGDELVAVIADTPQLVLFTAAGIVKKVNVEPWRAKVSVVALAGDDLVVAAASTADDHHLVLLSGAGQLLRCESVKVRAQGRPAGGMVGIKLDTDDVLLTGFSLPPDRFTTSLLVVSDVGGVKLTEMSQFPLKGRATGGVRAVRFTSAETRLLAASVDPNAFPFSGSLPLARPAPARRDGSTAKLDAAATAVGVLRP
jgi:DNA gyrase subunit A